MKTKKNNGGTKSSAQASVLANEEMVENSSGGFASGIMNASHGDGTWIRVPDHVIESISERLSGDPGKISQQSTEYLELGFRVMQMQGSLISIDEIEKAMERGERNLSSKSNELVSKLSEATTSIRKEMEQAYKDGNSELTDTLGGTVETLEAAVRVLIDPENKGSIRHLVVQDVRDMLSKAEQENAKAWDLTEKNSAAEKIVTTVEGKLSGLASQIASLEASIRTEREAIKEATGLKALVEESKAKANDRGKAFELQVSEMLGYLAGTFGDSLKDIGEETDGIGSSKIGDHLLTVKTGPKATGRIVVEDKVGKFTMSGASSLPSQLSTAMTNHNADAAIGIVNVKCAPKKLQKLGYISPQSNMHIVVVDCDDEDWAGLEILYPIVRQLIIIQQQTKNASESKIDSAAILDLCEEQLRKLSNFNKLKRNLRKQIAEPAENIAAELNVIQAELMDTFGRVIKLHREDDL